MPRYSPIEEHARQAQSNISSLANQLENGSSSSDFSRQFRSWDDFVDLQKMLRPLDVTQCVERIKFNLKFYTMNYLAFFALILVIFCLAVPALGLRLAVGIGLSAAVFKLLVEGQVIHVGEHRLVVLPVHKQILIALILFFALFDSEILSWLLVVFGISSGFILGHAMFRSRPSSFGEIDRACQAISSAFKNKAE